MLNPHKMESQVILSISRGTPWPRENLLRLEHKYNENEAKFNDMNKVLGEQ